MKIITSFIIFILLLSLGCAQQTTPTGGPKDTIPPTLLGTQPPNKSVHFNAKTIQLTFDEFITLNNPREQLLITPSIGKEFEATVRKRTVHLELLSELQDSTTYTINFRESIHDVTEKNSVENLKYVFSTGSYLDSLTIAGTVYELLSGQLVENATVALYHEPDTFLIFDDTPTYATRTNEDGRFLFENLKPDVYYIYAFNDKNNNLKIDSKTEKYGFLVAPIDLQPETKPSVSIPLIALDARELKMMSARPSNTYFAIRMSKSLAEYTLLPVNQQDSIYLYHILSPDHTTVQVYFQDQPTDSIAINFQARDSIGFQFDTLLYAKPNSRQVTPENLTFAITEPPLISSEDHVLSLALKFSKPIEYMQLDSMVYIIDSLNRVEFNPDDFLWINNNTLKISKSLPDSLFPSPDPEAGSDFRTASPIEKSFISELQFKTGAFISLENDSSRKIIQTVPYLLPGNTSIIIGTINVPSQDSTIFQIIDRDLNVIRERYRHRNVTFGFLLPGTYLLRAISDQNGNRIWDTGNYFEKKEPEPVYFYRTDEGEPLINLKVNWELGPLLITDELPVDNPSKRTR